MEQHENSTESRVTWPGASLLAPAETSTIRKRARFVHILRGRHPFFFWRRV
jgi:hypothetical protein